MPHSDCRLAIALVDDELAALDGQVGEGAGAPESHAAADGADYRSAHAVDRHAAADVDSHGMSGRPLRKARGPLVAAAPARVPRNDPRTVGRRFDQPSAEGT